MKNTKRFFPIFRFYDRTGIEKYLEDKALDGWMLKKVTGFGWIFEKCKPKKINYSVTYFPKASAFDPDPTEEQLTFTEFCGHTGWVFTAQNAQMQIFYNEKEDPVPIETDADIELENIHKSAKKSFLPTYYILMLNGVIQALTFFQRWKLDPVGVLTSNAALFTGLSWVLMLTLCLTEMGAYFSWRKKALRAAEEDGSFIETSSNQGFQMIILALMLTGFAMMTGSLNNAVLLKTVIYTLTGVMLIVLLLVKISDALKKMKVSKSVNAFVTFGGSIIFGLIFAFGVIYILAGSTGSLGHDPVSTYEWGIFEIEVYDDPVPLRIEDMKDIDYDRYSYEMWHEESIFAKKYDCAQEPHISDSDEVPELRYTLYEMKFSPLYDWFAEKLCHDLTDSYSDDGQQIAELKAVDPSPFYADAAYRLYYRNDEPMNRYLLFYKNNIVELRPDWEMTEEEMNVVGRTLGIVTE